MTNPKPLFTAKHFDTGLFAGPPVIDIHEAADIANGIVAPLQAEVERLAAEGRESADKLSAANLLISRLREKWQDALAQRDDANIHGEDLSREIMDLKNALSRIKHECVCAETVLRYTAADNERLRAELVEAREALNIVEGCNSPSCNCADIARGALSGEQK